MFALISTDELQELNQLMVKQLKNRYSDPSSNKRFVIGVDRPKMRLYDVEETAQHDLIDSPSPQSSGKPVAPDGFNPSKKFGSKDFSNLFGEGQ